MKTTGFISRQLFVCLLLVAITLAVYWPVRQFEFVNYDDPEYVTHNAMVREGLTWEGVRWASTTGHAHNWHPLTWLSLMADAEWRGPANAGGFHLR